MKKVIYGFDILKFFMAMMVALGHLKGLDELPSVEFFFLPFMGAAVPKFFVISSFLFWRKKNIPSIEKYCYRLLVLYLGWHIFYSPIKFHQYVMCNSGGVITFIKDFFLGYSLSGGWFVASLIWGMLLLYILKKCKIHDVIVIMVAAFSYMFVYMHEVIGSGIINSFYVNIQYFLNNKLFYSPFVSFPWIVLGYMMSKTKVISLFEKNNKTANKIVVLVGICSMIVDMVYPDYWYFPTITLTWSLFMYFYMLEVAESSIWKYLRNYSIIIFFVHFFFLRFMFEPNIVSFIVYYTASLAIAIVMVYLSNKNKFKILRKLY